MRHMDGGICSDGKRDAIASNKCADFLPIPCIAPVHAARDSPSVKAHTERKRERIWSRRKSKADRVLRICSISCDAQIAHRRHCDGEVV